MCTAVKPPVVIRAVGFDLDMTLAVPERDRTALLADAVEAVGAPPISREEYLDAHDEHLTAETREPIFDAILATYEADIHPRDLARAYRVAVNEALVSLPGATGLVRELQRGYRVGLLTDGPVRAQTEKLEKLGWTDLFDPTVITGSLPAGKPDPRTFEALVSGLGTTPGETAYVGDHPEFDVTGATAMGLRTVQVLYDGGPDPHPDADATVEQTTIARDLPGVLEDL
jgi:putative hydrolase of the HAD superfamily